MEDTLEVVQFIANSANRVLVLDALTREPTTRSEIQSETGVSRSTVLRTLDRCEERGWVESEGSRYWITPLGQQVTVAFLTYVETAEGIRNLGEAINWLPEPVYSLDFRHFGDAEVVTPEPTNPNAPFDRGIELIREAETYRGLTATAIPSYVEALGERVEAGDVECVIEAGFLERITDDPRRIAAWRDIAASTRVYGGNVPINMHFADGTVLIWLGSTDSGDLEVYGLLECEDRAVASWAESLFCEYWDEADPLDPDDLTTG